MPGTSHDFRFFSELLEQSFTVTEEGREIALRLTRIDKRETAPKGWESFTMLFDGPPAACLPQGTHQLVHEKVGTVPVFLVPVAEDEEGYQYEAVFNIKQT